MSSTPDVATLLCQASDLSVERAHCLLERMHPGLAFAIEQKLSEQRERQRSGTSSSASSLDTLKPQNLYSLFGRHDLAGKRVGNYELKCFTVIAVVVVVINSPPCFPHRAGFRSGLPYTLPFVSSFSGLAQCFQGTDAETQSTTAQGKDGSVEDGMKAAAARSLWRFPGCVKGGEKLVLDSVLSRRRTDSGEREREREREREKVKVYVRACFGLPEDYRLESVRSLLQSSKPAVISRTVENEHAENREGAHVFQNQLFAMAQRTSALPLGRGALSLGLHCDRERL